MAQLMLCHVPPVQVQSADPDERQRHSAVPLGSLGFASGAQGAFAECLTGIDTGDNITMGGKAHSFQPATKNF